jgi:hypothetical protein
MCKTTVSTIALAALVFGGFPAAQAQEPKPISPFVAADGLALAQIARTKAKAAGATDAEIKKMLDQLSSDNKKLDQTLRNSM